VKTALRPPVTAIAVKPNKLYTVLQTLTRIEQNRLRKYVQSPYFNANEKLAQLLELLLDNLNAPYAEEWTREHYWQALCPDEPFNDVRLRKMQSDLLGMVEDFFAQQVYDNQKMRQAIYLTQAVRQREIDNLYASTLRAIAHLRAKNPFQSADFYLEQYDIEKSLYDLEQRALNRSERNNVERIINNLDYFYLSEKLRWYCTVLSQNNLVSHEYQLLFIDEIIAHIRQYRYEDIPIIAIYFHVLLTQSESSEEAHYFRLKELLQQHSSLLPPEELFDLYSLALNYCAKKINQGKADFLREFYKLYRYCLERGILYDPKNKHELSPWHFKNVVMASLRVGEYDWTEHLIKNYQDKLPKDYRENAISYNLAQVYFYTKKYDKAMELLRGVKYDDIAYELGARVMLMSMYYEQDEYNALDSLMKSFRTYLMRHHDLNETRRNQCLNQIKFVTKLTKLLASDKKAVQALKTEIQETQHVANAAWLMEQLRHFE
jgi:hypothetical protein